jgi:hypothetical protein
MANLNLPNTLHEIMLPDSSHQMILSDEISSYPGADCLKRFPKTFGLQRLLVLSSLLPSRSLSGFAQIRQNQSKR